MKKVILKLVLFCICILPIGVFAVENVDFVVEDMYINSQVDVIGSMRVTEAIIIKGSLNGFERTINFKNPKLGEWNGGKVDFAKSAIYNARAVNIKSVSSFKINEDEIGWTVLNKSYDNFQKVENASKGESGVYTQNSTDYGTTVKVFNPNNSGYVVYLFEYFISQAVVLHNDVAELYWTFLPLDFDYVKNAHIQVTVPGYSKVDNFRFWAHGPLNGTISAIKDKTDEEGNDLYRGVNVSASKINTGDGIDIRMTFDKNIMGAGSSIITQSGVDALDEIIKVEEYRANDANRRRQTAKIIEFGLIGLSVAYEIGLVILWLFVYKKYDREYKVNFNMKYYREFTGDYGVEVVDYLMNQSIGTNAMSASIMNLIYKGNIEVIESANSKKEVTLKLKNRDNLSTSEEKLIRLLFDKIAKGDQVSTKEIEKYSSKYSTADKFMKSYNSWKDSVESEAIKEKFFEDHTVHKLAALSYFILGIIIVVLMFALKAVNNIALLVIIVSSIVFLIYILSFKKWTLKGREHYLKWKAFKNFLTDFGNLKEKELPEIKLWEKYLVYATVFGIAKEVQKTMKIKLSEMSNVDSFYLNSWYFHTNYYIGNTISSSVNKVYSGSANTIAAHSSSSSGGGFGGGFSSGGGFGGGGGGGHGF